VSTKTLEENYMELAKECAEARVNLATLKETIKEALDVLRENRNGRGIEKAIYVLNPCDECEGTGEFEVDTGTRVCVFCRGPE
jgi:hypothetical protein